MTKLVSVIIPSFNRSETIGRAIISVLNQSYSNLELIVVDDASTDNTFDVVRTFVDDRLKYYKLDRNIGGAAARNFGIEKSIGEFIAFQDSDDEWLCNKLKSDTDIFEHHQNIGCVFSRYWQVNGKFSKLVPMNSSVDSDCLYDSLLVRNLIGTPTAIVRRSVITQVNGFNNELPRYQDWEIFIRISRDYTIHMNPDVNVIAYVSADSLSNNNLAHLKALELIYKEHYYQITKKKELNSLWLWNIGEAQALNSFKFRDKMLESLSNKLSPIRLLKFLMLFVFGVRFYNIYRDFKFKLLKFVAGSRLSAWLKKEDY